MSKVALVTGASVGIGEATAKRLLADGYVVYAAARRMDRMAPLAAAGARLIALDLTDDASIVATAERIRGEAGRLDVLVNNAGSLIRRVPFLELGWDTYDAVMNLNVKSVIEGSQAAVPHMERQGGGAIINVGSIAGNDGGGPGSAVYASSKAFVHNLTRHLARDLGAKGIRVNAVSPGVIATPFHAATPPERMEAMRKSVLLGRIGTPAECVGAFLFLASPSLSGYITGQNLHVNGGQLMP